VSVAHPRDALPSPRLVIASRNRGKIAEMGQLLAPYPLRLMSLDEARFAGELAEPGPGYVENAMAKAMAVCAATGLATLADDSGIEVDALRGWPGPISARWMGDTAGDADRIRGLLDEVARRCPDDPRARYVCFMALARPQAEPLVARGECWGRLVEPRGDRGFGYDPAFLSDDLGMTFGEADAAAKDHVSHRARAVARLAESGLLGRASGVPA
jgi:XTP/dITP diphosphohydrolase